MVSVCEAEITPFQCQTFRLFPYQKNSKNANGVDKQEKLVNC